MPRDAYEVLGVGRAADETEIKKAFRRLARELHPDTNSEDPQAEDKFKEAAEAYEILSDPDRRRQYDAYGHEGLRSGGYAPNFEGFGSVSDLFSAFFGSGGFDNAFGGGRGRGGQLQGADVVVAVAIDLGQAARGERVPNGRRRLWAFLTGFSGARRRLEYSQQRQPPASMGGSSHRTPTSRRCSATDIC